MPIRPELLHFYRGPQWQHTRRPILERAGYRCELCKVPQYKTVRRFHGSWLDADKLRWRDDRGNLIEAKAPPPYSETHWVKIVLHVCHVNHISGDDRDENLLCLCQWHHLEFDQAKHRETRSARKDLARPLLLEANA